MTSRGLALILFATVVVAGSAGLWWRMGHANRPNAGSLGEQEALWTERIGDIGGKKAYAQFAQDVADLSPAKQHEGAHAFGAALFSIEDTDGLSVCDARFSYGCFHEFLGRAIASHGLAIVKELNQGCVDSLVESPLSCQHGIGHGIIAFLGYDDTALRKSLDECKALPYNDPIGGCYGGVFMEYNMQTMLGTEARIRQPSTPQEMYEPCASLPEAFKSSCVFWQPQWWHSGVFQGEATDEVFAKLGENCRGMTRGDASLVRTCFEGIGNIVPPAAGFDGKRAAELCDATSPHAIERLYCRSLAANSLGGGGAGKVGDGAAVCSGLTKDSYAYCMAYAKNIGNILEAQTPPDL